MYEQLMGDFTYKLREFSSDQPAPSLYIFPPTVVLRTLFLILDIRCELTILVWFTEPSKPSLEHHIKTNSNTVLSSFILDSDLYKNKLPYSSELYLK